MGRYLPLGGAGMAADRWEAVQDHGEPSAPSFLEFRVYETVGVNGPIEQA
jgi:hypothetical protein